MRIKSILILFLFCFVCLPATSVANTVSGIDYPDNPNNIDTVNRAKDPSVTTNEWFVVSDPFKTSGPVLVVVRAAVIGSQKQWQNACSEECNSTCENYLNATPNPKPGDIGATCIDTDPDPNEEWWECSGSTDYLCRCQVYKF